MKTNKHIEIVRSGTPRLSSMGLKSCIMLREVLSQHYAHVGVTYVNDERDLERLIAKSPDLVYLGFKSMPAVDQAAPDLWISERLAMHGVNYTGSTQPAMLLDNNKDAAKRVIRAAGLLTARSFSALPGDYSHASDLPLPFPLFVKPPQAGGGSGIDADSVVRDFVTFKRKVAALVRDFNTPALVETYLTGREFSVALLETDDELLAMPIELISQPNENGDQILSGKVKSEDSEHVIAVPAGSLRDALVSFATDAFEALGARDYGRIDLRMDVTGGLHFLEANLIPGVAQHDFTSYFTTACLLNRAMDYEAMVLGIVAPGLARSDTVSDVTLVSPRINISPDSLTSAITLV